MEVQGGDPACWADRVCPRCGAFVDEGRTHRCTTASHAGPGDGGLLVLVADAVQLVGEAEGSGVCWSLPEHSDLNVNLVRLEPDQAIETHRNDEVDLLVLVITGNGVLDVDGSTIELAAGTLAHVPKGARRSIHAAHEGLGYVTCHRRRDGLRIARPSAPSNDS